jgi:hypothetical protein
MKKLKNCLYLILAIFILISVYLHLTKESMLATINVTGITSKEEVEWKNPEGPLQKETLPTHEVLFSFHKEPLIKAFFWGDVIGVRYKTLELRSIFYWIGFSDIVEVEALCSDYTELEKKLKYPSKVLPLERKKASSFVKFYRSLWKKLFQDSENNFFMKRATLQIVYFPLDETNRSFHLSSQNGKLITD